MHVKPLPLSRVFGLSVFERNLLCVVAEWVGRFCRESVSRRPAPCEALCRLRAACPAKRRDKIPFLFEIQTNNKQIVKQNTVQHITKHTTNILRNIIRTYRRIRHCITAMSKPPRPQIPSLIRDHRANSTRHKNRGPNAQTSLLQLCPPSLVP